MSVITENNFSEPPVRSKLNPGEVLMHCNGQDILRKGSSGSSNRNKLNKVLIVLPVHFALPSKVVDCRIGTLRNVHSERPELDIKTSKGIIRLFGQYQFPRNYFLSIHCQPSFKKIGQSTLSDIYDRVLVFDEHEIIVSEATDEDSQSSQLYLPLSQPALADSQLSNTQQSSQHDDQQQQVQIDSVQSSKEGNNQFLCHFGMSSLADPVHPSTLEKAKTAKAMNAGPMIAAGEGLPLSSSVRMNEISSLSKRSGGKKVFASNSGKKATRKGAKSDSDSCDHSFDNDRSSNSDEGLVSKGSDSDDASDYEEGNPGNVDVDSDGEPKRRQSSGRIAARGPISYSFALDSPVEVDSEDENEMRPQRKKNLSSKDSQQQRRTTETSKKSGQKLVASGSKIAAVKKQPTKKVESKAVTRKKRSRLDESSTESISDADDDDSDFTEEVAPKKKKKVNSSSLKKSQKVGSKRLSAAKKQTVKDEEVVDLLSDSN